jgi:phosphopantothenoylcysteine decarboxylase/phosphopantothenate--cysteine ligase
MRLQGKKILLGITGSIAAYKAAGLVRLLKKEGAEVQVVASTSALFFITPLTLATLSEKPVLTGFTNSDSGTWNNHVALGLWADLMLVAPLSAQTLAKMAVGLCDNLLMAVYLSARCPVMVAPAMDLDMYAHPTTRENLQKLADRGNMVIAARTGELASGLTGQGRMAEPEELLEATIQFFEATPKPLAGKVALVTAGPTQEPLDPVRYLSNHSSGKMGFAIAAALQEAGAKVFLLTGPVHLPDPPGCEVIRVTTAQEMFEQAAALHARLDVAVFSAAVADYRPGEIADQKIKKQGDDLSIWLVKNPDIALELGKNKKPGQIHVGFALETQNGLQEAERKLQAKNFDFVVLNQLTNQGAGFQHDTNQVQFISRGGTKSFPLKTKKDVARDIVQELTGLLPEDRGSSPNIPE